MNCDRRLLSYYRDGQLSVKQRYEVDCHLIGCERCTADLRGLMRLAQVIRSLPMEPVDPRLGQEVRRLVAGRPFDRRRGIVLGGLARGLAPAVVAVSVALSLIVGFRSGALETMSPAPVLAPAASVDGPVAAAPESATGDAQPSGDAARSPSAPVAPLQGNPMVSLPAEASASADVPVPIARFYGSNQQARQMLGDALPGSRTVTLLEQSFQGGLAIWRSDTRQIYVLRREGNAWSAHADTWQPGDHVSIDLTPPPGAMLPSGGFASVWRSTPEIRKRLGWAVYEPRGSGASIQMFERGMVVWTPHGLIYVLTNDGHWRTFADAAPM